MSPEDFTPNQLRMLDRNMRIVRLYQAIDGGGLQKYKPADIASAIGCSKSTVLRAVQAAGVVLSQAEASRAVTHLKRARIRSMPMR